MCRYVPWDASSLPLTRLGLNNQLPLPLPLQAEAVYAALTSYESLGTFIPGLAENRCLERHEDGCTLLQVGRSLFCL